MAVDEFGVEATEEPEIADLFITFFKDLFTSSDPTKTHILEGLAGVTSRLTASQQLELDRDFTSEEVEAAVKAIGLHKAPGPDGVHAIFYQTHWDLVGTAITMACLRCLNHGDRLDGINYTNIVLIAKKQNAKLVTDFRPISLMNVLYKIVAKVVANRLKEVFPSLINETQSAFIKWHHITNNVLVAFDCTHSMKRNTNGSKGFLALKLDMSKAYDRSGDSFLWQSI